jgi:putative ABC transport system ATP-binding protein
VALIEAVDLCKYYRQGRSVVRAVDGVSLAVESGELAAVMGRSGSGKTTLLDLLGLLQRPTAGSVIVDGVETGGLRDRQLTALRRRRLGFVFQEYNLLPTLNVVENVLAPVWYERSVPVREGLRRARWLLELVGLADRAAHFPTELSGGERQRVAIARALVLEPAVVLADEPTAAVDSETAAGLLDLFRRLNDAGMTFLVVTHDPAVAAVANRVIRMSDGRVAEAIAQRTASASLSACSRAGAAMNRISSSQPFAWNSSTRSLA